MTGPGHTRIDPPELGRPRGYSNGILAAKGRLLFVAGQIGWSSEQALVSADFVDQFRRALENVLTVLAAAGGRPEHVCRLAIYVVDKKEYVSRTREVGRAYRELMGKHFPAMVLVEVRALLEEGAKVEIEATAVVPEQAKRAASRRRAKAHSPSEAEASWPEGEG